MQKPGKVGRGVHVDVGCRDLINDETGVGRVDGVVGCELVNHIRHGRQRNENRPRSYRRIQKLRDILNLWKKTKIP
jgi:hypothetical protein